MKSLQKIKNGNFRMNYFKFSKIPYLENFTRCKSFIIYDFCEIYHPVWYEMFLKISNTLQKAKPLDISYLLLVESNISKHMMFLDHYEQGYLETDFGLYVKNYGNTNQIVDAIERLLEIYGINKEDAYMVVEVAPKYKDDYSEIIDEEKLKFCQFFKANYINPETHYEYCSEIIDNLNASLQYFSSTSYNNLYILNLGDFDKYATQAIKTQLDRTNNCYTLKELTLAVEWLRQARFYGNDLYNDKYIKGDGFFIEDGDRAISILFETHFYDVDLVTKGSGSDD